MSVSGVWNVAVEKCSGNCHARMRGNGGRGGAEGGGRRSDGLAADRGRRGRGFRGCGKGGLGWPRDMFDAHDAGHGLVP